MEPIKNFEIQLLTQLRKNVSDLNFSPEDLEDRNLLRFLRARNHVLKNAEKMLRKHHDWVIEVRLHSLVKDGAPSGFDKEFPWQVLAVHENCPVIYADYGRWDFLPVVKAGRTEELIRYVLYIIECELRLARHVSEGKETGGQVIILQDLRGIHWEHLANKDVFDGAISLVKIFEANYPELLRTFIVLNAPWFFTVAWRAIKPLLSEHTRKKVIVLGHSANEWHLELPKVVPLSCVPKCYGGELEDNVNLFPEFEKYIL